MADPYVNTGPDNWGNPGLARTLADAVRRAIDKKSPGGESSEIPIAMIRYATVTQISPLLISLGADPTAQAAKRLSSYAPTVGHLVAVLQPTSGQLLVLGQVV
jgi:hypothetical protein